MRGISTLLTIIATTAATIAVMSAMAAIVSAIEKSNMSKRLQKCSSYRDVFFQLYKNSKINKESCKGVFDASVIRSISDELRCKSKWMRDKKENKKRLIAYSLMFVFCSLICSGAAFYNINKIAYVQKHVSINGLYAASDKDCLTYQYMIEHKNGDVELKYDTVAPTTIYVSDEKEPQVIIEKKIGKADITVEIYIPFGCTTGNFPYIEKPAKYADTPVSIEVKGDIIYGQKKEK